MSKAAQGFSLTDLMAGVIIIGVLSSIALPSFRSYVRKSQVSEAFMHLGELSRSAAAYYETDHEVQGLGSRTLARCLVETSAILPVLPPRATKQLTDFSQDPSYTALRFNPADPLYHVYQIMAGEQGCSVEDAAIAYRLLAGSDLNEDERYEVVELRMSVIKGTMVRHPGVAEYLDWPTN